MLIGTIRLHLYLDTKTLKEKRRIISSLKEKTRNKFNASIAEVDYNDDHSNAVIGIAVVSNDGNYLNSVLYSILDFINKEFPTIVGDYQVEII
ncbi:MAG: DUF503 domain-containing protein [Spirochaetia bacterium]|nr:DUF503 domain-containing protein [Spirochaetota bacterium]MCX8097048.1 DUF503 domain-containing protein [Spirochaetota bacterium]MDW8111757.1 DUF503 domain-containing protein [Spirochaetia bacterium]